MRFFDEDAGDKTAKETLVMMTMGDAQTIYVALEEFVKNNKRKVKAKRLLADMEKKWGIW